jgi:fructose-1,6-bisphosphatase/sedoheptulose 1,7-bisphosphatase-like protein
MKIKGLKLAALLAPALALAGCGDRPPGDATGAKVLRNILEKNGVDGRIVSFKKVQGREIKRDNVDAYEVMYEAEVQFPEGYDAKCAEERERGKCAFLGLDADQTFVKNEILRSEGTLHFVKNGKGWLAEDKNEY